MFNFFFDSFDFFLAKVSIYTHIMISRTINLMYGILLKWFNLRLMSIHLWFETNPSHCESNNDSDWRCSIPEKNVISLKLFLKWIFHEFFRNKYRIRYCYLITEIKDCLLFIFISQKIPINCCVESVAFFLWMNASEW